MKQQAMALELYETRRDMLVDYATRLLGDAAQAEDVVQDAWIQFAAQADHERIRDPAGYLHRMVRNLALDLLRRAKRYRRFAGEDMERAVRTVEDSAASAEHTLIVRQEYDRILECLAGLPERQRLAIEMHRIGGYKMREIADRLGVSIPYVHSLIARGLAACDARRDKELQDDRPPPVG